MVLAGTLLECYGFISVATCTTVALTVGARLRHAFAQVLFFAAIGAVCVPSVGASLHRISHDPGLLATSAAMAGVAAWLLLARQPRHSHDREREATYFPPAAGRG